jgi:hypothetical protein
LYERAKSLIPFEDSTFDIGHIQAPLLLSVVKSQFGKLNAS